MRRAAGRRARAGAAGLSFLLVGGPAIAGETPRYEAVPAWVTPVPPPAPDPAKPDDGGPLFQIMDQQTRIVDGEAWTYSERAVRALSADALARFGTVSLDWQPYHGDLIVHRVDILRDGRRIDVLKSGQKFGVIRREQKLERFEMDGILTATLQVEGLRVGDVLDVVYSVTSRDPVLKGAVQSAGLAMSAPFKVGFARARFLWPAGTPLRWRAYPDGLVATETRKGGWNELAIGLPGPKQPELPADAPPRFHRLPIVEVASFPDWPAVSKIVAPLYATGGLIAPDGPLAQEVARIAAAQRDPRARAAAALALVQDRVRYFANGMNGGNYTPQAPARTWAAGYGDCKAKTLLLLAILDALGIEAEPVLASIGQGDYVADRLPALAAFNHILVHARIDGADLWMDGTGRGSRLDDLQDPPPLRWVLPVRAGGAELLRLPFRAPSRPTETVTVDIDERAGIGLPAPFEATVTTRGAAADSLRVASAQMDKEQLQALALAALGGAAGPAAMPVTQKIAFDPAAGTATVTVAGLTLAPWQRQDRRYRYRPAGSIIGFTLGGDRARPAWKDIPVATGAPSHRLVTTRVHLPENGRRIVLEGDETLDLDVAGRRLARRATLADGVLTIEDRTTASGIELAAAELPPARSKLAAAQNRLLRLATGTDYPPFHAQVLAARNARQLDRLAGFYTARIADKPDDVGRYLARASFYQGTFQWKEALADLDKAIAMDGDAANLFRRATLRERIGDAAGAMADFRAGLALQPESRPGIVRLGLLRIDAGQKAATLAEVQAHLDAAGEDRPEWLGIKAQLLARARDGDGALAALDEAIAARPGNAALLNERCWTKATLDIQLDTALKDCTRAIELASNNAAALNSRALAYLRMNRLEEALADANASLEEWPDFPESLFLRAIIERGGNKADAAADLAGARLMAPRIDEQFARWKIVP